MSTEAIVEPNLEQAVPFFRVADIGQSVRFYVEGLGFRIGPEWRVEGELRWCWLSRGGVAFMLQQFPAEGHNGWKPSGKVGEGVSICVMCKDAVGLHDELRNRGIEASSPRVANGLWVTTVIDPDGFRIDFESPADSSRDDAQFR
jgi:lactoylglutathione lyase